MMIGNQLHIVKEPANNFCAQDTGIHSGETVQAKQGYLVTSSSHYWIMKSVFLCRILEMFSCPIQRDTFKCLPYTNPDEHCNTGNIVQC